MIKRLLKNKDRLKKEVEETEKLQQQEVQEKILNENFLGFVLLDEINFDTNKFVSDFKEDWNIDICSSATINENSLLFEEDGIIASVALLESPIPNHEAEENAKSNFYWKEAESTVKKHQAHIIIAVLNKNQNQIKVGEFFVKIAASILLQENATSFMTLNTVFRGGFYRDNALETMRDEQRFPILNLVFFELYTTDQETVSGYTYGLESLGKHELEIIESKNSLEDVHQLLYNITAYILNYDITLKSGETIGLSEDEKLLITESLGFALDTNMLTLKIDY